MSIGGFEKLQHILGLLEGHMHVHSSAHAQERPVTDLISHLWLTLRLCTIRN